MKRGDKPERVHNVLGRVLARRGFARRLEQFRLVDEWAGLVGPHIAAVTRAESVSADSVLNVSVKTHAWMSELSLLEPEILRSINRGREVNPIVKIRWQLMR
ncbi:MAG: DciA family protein [Gemmatimonadaceae bacterium]